MAAGKPREPVKEANPSPRVPCCWSAVLSERTALNGAVDTTKKSEGEGIGPLGLQRDIRTAKSLTAKSKALANWLWNGNERLHPIERDLSSDHYSTAKTGIPKVKVRGR